MFDLLAHRVDCPCHDRSGLVPVDSELRAEAQPGLSGEEHPGDRHHRALLTVGEVGEFARNERAEMFGVLAGLVRVPPRICVEQRFGLGLDVVVLEDAHDLDRRRREVLHPVGVGGCVPAGGREALGQRIDERRAIGEVSIDGALGDAGSSGQLPRRHFVDRAIGQQGDESVEDLVAGLVGLSFPQWRGVLAVAHDDHISRRDMY